MANMLQTGCILKNLKGIASERFSIHWFTAKMTTVTGAGPGWSREPETLSLPCGWLWAHFFHFPQAFAGNLIGSRVTRTWSGTFGVNKQWLSLLYHNACPSFELLIVMSLGKPWLHFSSAVVIIVECSKRRQYQLHQGRHGAETKPQIAPPEREEQETS